MFNGKQRFTTSVVVLALLALGLPTGCNALDFVPLATATKTISEVFKTGNSPKIVIDTFNGSIDVSQGDVDEVVVEVTKRASGFDQPAADANLENIEVTMVQKDNTIEITARRVGPPINNCGASIVIAVPAMAQLKLKSSNGYIVSEGVQGGIEANTSNGRLEILQARGAIKATTSNGPVEIEATDGIVDARSSNGRVVFRGSLADAEQRFKTSNGKIEVNLPADSSFKLESSTSNGSIHCAFPIEGESKKRRNRLNGTVGTDPKFSLHVSTSNGSIDLRKSNAANE